MRTVLKFLRFIVWSAVVITLGYGYYELVDGFFPFRTKITMKKDVAWTCKEGDLSSILSQNFYYLDKGCRAYAFVSQDDQYVLKLFKQNQLWSLDSLTFKWLPETLKKPIEIGTAKRMVRKKHRRSSLKLAYDRLREESALIAIHLDATDQLHQKIRVYNRIGIPHEIDADSTVFILQKKGDTFGEYLKTHLDDKEGVKRVIDSLFDLFDHRVAMGILDHDRGPKLFRNYGVLNGKIFWLDIGSIYVGKTAPSWDSETAHLLKQLLNFMKEHDPDLYTYCQNKIETREKCKDVNTCP